MIGSRMKTSVLTPRLQDLSSTILDVTDLTLCSILASDSLTSLTLDFTPRMQEPSMDVLYSIFSRAPQLRTLSVYAHLSFFDGDFPRTLRQATSHLQLEKLSLTIRVCSLRLPSIVRGIGATLPVTHLSVWNYSDVPRLIEAGFGEGLFASLTSFKICAGFAGMSSCFPGIPRLKNLFVDSKSPEDASTLDRLLSSASAHLASLDDLQIVSSDCVDEGLLTFALLSRHSVMRRLSTFMLCWRTALKGSNDDLDSLLFHMRNIERLCLTCNLAKNKSDLTLDVLPACAYRCPKLRSLSLPIDCRIPPSAEALADEYSRRSALKSLDLWDSLINKGEPHILASWLNRLLPISCFVAIHWFPAREELEEELRRLRSTSD